MPRWSLLAGKFLGVLAFVALQASLFVGGTWLALGLRTGVWDPTYFLCVPILLTPKGAVMGFRERTWRDFLDIGKGRA